MTKEPIARSHDATLKNDDIIRVNSCPLAVRRPPTVASQSTIHQYHLRAHNRYRGCTRIIEVQQASPIFESPAASNQIDPPVAMPERQEPLLVQIQITTNT